MNAHHQSIHGSFTDLDSSGNAAHAARQQNTKQYSAEEEAIENHRTRQLDFEWLQYEPKFSEIPPLQLPQHVYESGTVTPSSLETVDWSQLGKNVVCFPSLADDIHVKTLPNNSRVVHPV